jgi:hypothetical protein
MPWCGLALARATMWCGGMVGPPGVSQVPLCPIFEVKNLKTIFWNFLTNFIFEDFQKLTNEYKLGKNEYGTMENKLKPSLHQFQNNHICN